MLVITTPRNGFYLCRGLYLIAMLQSTEQKLSDVFARCGPTRRRTREYKPTDASHGMGNNNFSSATRACLYLFCVEPTYINVVQVADV